jgi:HEAT repeat protein
VIGCRKVNKLVHLQAANALTALARIAATYEDFELVRRLGAALEEIILTDPLGHSACCQPALTGLLVPTAVDRVAELFLEKKNDSAWIKTVSVLLRWASPEAMERLFVRLDNEALAGPRLAMVRLLGRLGSSAIDAARRRLTSPEWYVVRNACKILGDLKDPDLLRHIGPAFENKDERVQKAALQAVIDSRLPGRAAAIANALPALAPSLVEDALLELMFEGDPQSLPGLERCYTLPMQAPVLARIVNVIAAVQHQDAVFLLANICRREDLPQTVRSAALQAMEFRNSKKGQRPAKPAEVNELAIKNLVLRGA